MAEFLRATGTVLRVEEKRGTYTDKEGRTQPWGFDVVRLLTGDAEMTDVTFDPERFTAPTRGEVIDVAVKVALRPGKGGFGPSINIDAVAPWDASNAA